MERQEYMTTGEFASAMGVSKDTLFHYDEIGLFCPEKVGDNGYRFYSIYQMETFDTIRMLRDLGMSLKEIRQLLENRSLEHVVAIFKEREMQIDQEIEKLKSMKRWISRRQQKIEDVAHTDFSRVEIREFPERYYLYGYVADGSEKAIYRKTSELISEFKHSGMRSDYDVAYIQYEENVQSQNFLEYDNTILLLDEPPTTGQPQILPGGKYLVAYHVGHWLYIGQAYERLLQYKKAHHLKTEDFYIERYVVDNFIAKDEENYVNEIAVRIIEEEKK